MRFKFNITKDIKTKYLFHLKLMVFYSYIELLEIDSIEILIL